jgi:hypothetical protein
MDVDGRSTRLSEMLAAGTPLYVVREEPMTEEERKPLLASGRQQMAMYVLMGIGIVGVPFLASAEELSDFYKYLISSALLLGYGWLIIAAYRKMQKGYAAPKKVISGFVTAKSRKPMKRGYAHELTIGKDQVIPVTTGMYHRYEVGDAVECHLFSGWGTVLLGLYPIESELPRQ